MNLTETLSELQWKQLQHDKLYHSDIWILSVQQRIKHMVLHIAKYSSKVNIAAYDQNDGEFNDVLLDTFIISVSTMNILNSSIAPLVIGEWSIDPSLSFEDLNKKLSEGSTIDMHQTAYQLSQITYSLCKAIEATDHFEMYSYRDVILNSYKKILKLCFTNLETSSLISQIESRLYSVEERNIHFKRIGNYKDGYKCFGAEIN